MKQRQQPPEQRSVNGSYETLSGYGFVAVAVSVVAATSMRYFVQNDFGLTVMLDIYFCFFLFHFPFSFSFSFAISLCSSLVIYL